MSIRKFHDPGQNLRVTTGNCQLPIDPYHAFMASTNGAMNQYGYEDWECDCCGACCRTFPIFVSERDARREPRIAIEGKRLPLHLVDGPWEIRLFPLPFLDSCPFLDGQDRCEIYDSRPEVCRMVEAGDSQCQEARRRHGIPDLKPKTPWQDENYKPW